MRRRILGISLLVMLAALTLLPPLFGFLPIIPAVVSANPVTPGPNDLNATTPLIAYDEYTPATPDGNSSLFDVLVTLVNASDIGECKAGQLTNHTFGVYFTENESLVFEDDLEYIADTGWAAYNYSLLQWNLNASTYKVRCFFERDTGTEIWNTTTEFSSSFQYKHRITIGTPDFTYIGDTSDTIDIWTEHISSTIWGTLTSVTNTSIAFEQVANTSNVENFYDVLQYNVTSTLWEVHELNVSILIPDEAYKIIIFANYSLKPPDHQGLSTKSDTFTFQGPYLRIAKPLTFYVGREIQLLNLTVSWVWHSIFGNLTGPDITIANFSIFLASGSGALVNGTLSYNSTGVYWYFYDLNVSDYIEQGIFTIGEAYNVSTFFHAPGQDGRTEVNASSPFSLTFLIDRDAPSILQSSVTPDNPTFQDFVILTSEVSDDALIHTVICSYFNGSQWVNVTMRGTQSKSANYSVTLPPFPELFEVQYRIFANDTQNAWGNSTITYYTVINTPPLIAHVSYLPSTPTDNDLVTINATITDGTAVSTVQLFYSWDGLNYVAIDMVNIGGDLYQAVIPSYPARMPNFQFESVYFRIHATDTFDSVRDSATFAYLVQGTMIAVDPTTALLLISVVALAIVIIIVLYKIYEQY
ncbi:MAG: hypothetical protein ACFFBU_05135 [Promethearchaeota archaeon]